MENLQNKHSVEILAPGGSVEGIMAALNSGADAVYAGGQMFGARAYASNRDTEKMTDTIKEVHRRGKKLYLTINTLLKENELNHQLVDYLIPYYEAGLDAVIVQDFGVFSMVKKHFPDLPIHASTQMTVVSPEFATLLRDMGATRVVPARELSLKEIRDLKEMSGLEVETFVHGALCYCYSGQCLMSSMIGGRSGNRGRCAQPCRLPYKFDVAGRQASQPDSPYLLSPKDICTLNMIPDMIEAGIDSFKIEGRMKKPEYAALVASLYRKYTDMYLKFGREGFKVDAADVNDLMDLYNRGGFTDGYYKQHNGRHMISLTKPNHFGTKAAEVTAIQKDKVTLKALEDLKRQDVLELSDGKQGTKPYEWTLKEDIAKGRTLTIPNRVKALKKGAICYRTRHEYLINAIKKQEAVCQNKEKLYAVLKIFKDLPVKMTVIYEDICVEVEGQPAQEALKRVTTREEVIKQISKTGNTPYEFEKIELDMGEDLFVPVTLLNQLRREALELLETRIQEKYQRTYIAPAADEEHEEVVTSSDEVQSVSVSVSQVHQLKAVLNTEAVHVIYADYEMVIGMKPDDWTNTIETAHQKNKKIMIALPYICREGFMNAHKAKILELAASVDGVMVRNVESFLFMKNSSYEKTIVFDSRIYTWNKKAKEFWKHQGASVLTVPEELNFKELMKRGCDGDEMIVYGHMPLMISAQCLMKTTAGCLKQTSGKAKPANDGSGVYRLTDRTGKAMMVKPCCTGCYNLIYNSQVLMLLDELENIRRLNPASIRLDFTCETEKMTANILRQFTDVWCGGTDTKNTLSDFTKGHFKRGVE